jgi:hypothetical protein
MAGDMRPRQPARLVAPIFDHAHMTAHREHGRGRVPAAVFFSGCAGHFRWSGKGALQTLRLKIGAQRQKCRLCYGARRCP